MNKTNLRESSTFAQTGLQLACAAVLVAVASPTAWAQSRVNRQIEDVMDLRPEPAPRVREPIMGGPTPGAGFVAPVVPPPVRVVEDPKSSPGQGAGSRVPPLPPATARTAPAAPPPPVVEALPVKPTVAGSQPGKNVGPGASPPKNPQQNPGQGAVPVSDVGSTARGTPPPTMSTSLAPPPPVSSTALAPPPTQPVTGPNTMVATTVAAPSPVVTDAYAPSHNPRRPHQRPGQGDGKNVVTVVAPPTPTVEANTPPSIPLQTASLHPAPAAVAAANPITSGDTATAAAVQPGRRAGLGEVLPSAQELGASMRATTANLKASDTPSLGQAAAVQPACVAVSFKPDASRTASTLVDFSGDGLIVSAIPNAHINAVFARVGYQPINIEQPVRWCVAQSAARELASGGHASPQAHASLLMQTATGGWQLMSQEQWQAQQASMQAAPAIMARATPLSRSASKIKVKPARAKTKPLTYALAR